MPVGANVRPAGEDVRQGELVLEAGTVIRAAEVGVLASLGLAQVKVVRRPIVSVLATGDELETAGSALSGGRIYDSNSFSVAASVVACGGVPRLLGHCPRQPRRPPRQAGRHRRLRPGDNLGWRL